MNRIRRALRAFKLAFRTSPPSFEELRDVWPQFNQPAKQQNLYAAIFETSSERARSQHVRSFKDVERAADGALAIRIPYMTASLPKREGFVYLIGVKARDETLASTSIIAVPEDAILHEDEAQKRDLFNDAAMLVHEGKLDGSVLVRAGALGWQPEERHDHVHETVGHFALHLAKGMLELNTAVSLLARAAEKLDHPDKAAEGRALLQQWLDERAENMHHYVDLVTEAVKVELGAE